MPLSPAGSTIVCAIESRYQESVIVNTYAYRTNATILSPVGAHNAFVAHAQAVIIPAYAAFQVQALVYKAVRTTSSTSTVQYAQIESALQAQQGLVDDSGLPSSVAAVLTRRGLQAGRAFRGRVYVAGVSRELLNTDTGRWTGGAIAQMQTGADKFQLPFDDVTNTVTWQPIVQRKNFLSFADIVRGTVNPVPRNQRRRQPGVGV